MEDVIRTFENRLTIYLGLKKITIDGYIGCLKRMFKKFNKINLTHPEIEEFILDMYKKEYSYTHIVNHCIAIERFSKQMGNPIRLGRPKKPKRIIRETLSESEISNMIMACRDIREGRL